MTKTKTPEGTPPVPDDAPARTDSDAPPPKPIERPAERKPGSDEEE